MVAINLISMCTVLTVCETNFCGIIDQFLFYIDLYCTLYTYFENLT